MLWINTGYVLSQKIQRLLQPFVNVLKMYLFLFWNILIKYNKQNRSLVKLTDSGYNNK